MMLDKDRYDLVCTSAADLGEAQRPRLVNGLNVGAGLTFVASGVSIAALSQR